jgi:hypothetical protein
MTFKDFLIAVAKNADTGKTQINAAEVNRVISEAFKILAKQDAATAAEVVAKGLALAKKKI